MFLPSKWRIVLIVVIVYKGVVTNGKHNEADIIAQLEKNSIIFGMSRLANESAINKICHSHLKQFEVAIVHREPWAMKVLDSSGTKANGFIFGHNHWLGSLEGCAAAQDTLAISMNNNYERKMHADLLASTSPFDVSYWVVYLQHKSPWQVEIKFKPEYESCIHVGLCLPTACTAEEIRNLTQYYFQSDLYVDANLFELNADVDYLKDFQISAAFYQRTSLKIIATVGLITSALILCAAYFKKRSSNLYESNERNTVETEAKAKGCWHIETIVRCFDIEENLNKIYYFGNRKSKDFLAINGLRPVFATIILILHVFWFTHLALNNQAIMLSWVEQIIFASFFSVDGFFVISGFLQTYKFISSTKQVEIVRSNTLYQNSMYFFKMLCHRLLRIAPAYFVVLCLTDLVFAYLKETSLYHMSDDQDGDCSRYWWRNALFIHSFFNWQELCADWTWSISCDMQYFMVTTVLLIGYAKKPSVVKRVAWVLLVGNMLYYYVVGSRTQFQISADVMSATGTDVYINPLLRATPYIVGAIVGGYFAEQQGQLKLSTRTEQGLWYLTICGVIFVLWPARSGLPWFSTITLLLIGRILVSFCVSFTIVASALGSSNLWIKVLESKIMQHLNRITYTFYLMNALLITLIAGMTSTSLSFNIPLSSVFIPGFFMISYGGAVILSLLFELPYCNWSNRIMKSTRQKSS